MYFLFRAGETFGICDLQSFLLHFPRSTSNTNTTSTTSTKYIP